MIFISMLVGELTVVEFILPAQDGIDTVVVGVKLIHSIESVVVLLGCMPNAALFDIYGIAFPAIPVEDMVTPDPVGVTVIHVPANTSAGSIF